jgi:hypothetical protein
VSPDWAQSANAALWVTNGPGFIFPLARYPQQPPDQPAQNSKKSGTAAGHADYGRHGDGNDMQAILDHMDGIIRPALRKYLTAVDA